MLLKPFQDDDITSLAEKMAAPEGHITYSLLSKVWPLAPHMYTVWYSLS